MKNLTFKAICLLLSYILAIGYINSQNVPLVSNSIFRDIQQSNSITTTVNSVVENSILPPPTKSTIKGLYIRQL